MSNSRQTDQLRSSRFRYAARLAAARADKNFTCGLDQWRSEPDLAVLPARLCRARGRRRVLAAFGAVVHERPGGLVYRRRGWVS